MTGVQTCALPDLARGPRGGTPGLQRESVPWPPTPRRGWGAGAQELGLGGAFIVFAFAVTSINSTPNLMLRSVPPTFSSRTVMVSGLTSKSLLPGESQGPGNLVGYRLWGRTESDTTEVT